MVQNSTIWVLISSSASVVVCYDCLIIRKLVSLRYNNVIVGLNDTMENLFASLNMNEPEIFPSTLYALLYHGKCSLY